MTPTTSRPRALLRAAVAALGLWLAVLAVLNLFIVGRAATDENLFIDPLSHLYVVEEVEGRPGTSRVFEPQAAFVPRQADAADAIAPGDVLIAIDGEVVLGRGEVLARIGGKPTVEVLVFRARKGQVLSVVLPSPALVDALRSIDKTVLVVQVTPGGASDRAGMLPGDVITRINGQGFSGALDADRIMRTSQVGRVSAYDVLRDGETVTLEVRLSAFGIGISALILFLVGGLYIVSGTLLATLRTHIKAAYYLGLGWMGAGFTIAMLTRPRRTLPTWYVISSDVSLAICATLGVAFWLHSMKYFPRERPGLVARRGVVRGAYVLALTLAVASLVFT